MVRLSIKYDEELKEQVFMLRGDEGYARSTTTLLQLGNAQLGSFGFDLPITFNVLRDRGDGKVVIYDNDVIAVMKVTGSNTPIPAIIDWTSTSNERSIVLDGLDYGIDHNIVAKYTGNNQCSPSSSKIETISIQDTYRTDAILSLQTGTQQFNPNDSLSDTVILSNDHDTDFNVGQLINVYYDGELITSANTDDEGTLSFTVDDVGSVGLHTLTVNYDGSDNLSSQEYSLDISVGYNLEIVSVPSLVVYDNDNTFSAKFTDWLGNPQVNEKIAVYSILPTMYRTICDDYTNSEGIVNITDFGYWVYREMQEGYYGEDHKTLVTADIRFSTIDDTYKTEIFNTTFITPQSFTVQATPPRMYKNENTSLVIDTQQPVENIPITITGSATGKAYTNSEGIANYTVMGEGVSQKSYTVSYGHLSQLITVDDYLQYWAPSDVHNRDYVTNGGQLQDLNNYFRLVLSNVSSTEGGALLLPISPNKEYEIEISGFNSSEDILIGFGKHNTVYGWNVYERFQTWRSYSNATIKLVLQDNTAYLYAYDSQGDLIDSRSNSMLVDLQNVDYIGMTIFVQIKKIPTINFNKLTFKEL